MVELRHHVLVPVTKFLLQIRLCGDVLTNPIAAIHHFLLNPSAGIRNRRIFASLFLKHLKAQKSLGARH